MNPVLPAWFLRRLARDAGVHLFQDRHDTLYASRHFLTLTPEAAGPCLIRLPSPADVINPFTGERLWRGVSVFEREFHAGETVLWRLA